MARGVFLTFSSPFSPGSAAVDGFSSDSFTPASPLSAAGASDDSPSGFDSSSSSSSSSSPDLPSSERSPLVAASGVPRRASVLAFRFAGYACPVPASCFSFRYSSSITNTLLRIFSSWSQPILAVISVRML